MVSIKKALLVFSIVVVYINSPLTKGFGVPKKLPSNQSSKATALAHLTSFFYKRKFEFLKGRVICQISDDNYI